MTPNGCLYFLLLLVDSPPAANCMILLWLPALIWRGWQLHKYWGGLSLLASLVWSAILQYCCWCGGLPGNKHSTCRLESCHLTMCFGNTGRSLLCCQMQELPPSTLTMPPSQMLAGQRPRQSLSWWSTWTHHLPCRVAVVQDSVPFSSQRYLVEQSKD